MQAEGEILQLPGQRVTAPKDFRAFFEDEHARLFKTLYFVTGDRSEAADLMQEAFLNRLPGLRPVANRATHRGTIRCRVGRAHVRRVIVDLGSGALTSLPVETAGAANAPAWFPRGDGIIIARHD